MVFIKKKVLIIFGTRPEAIKMAPVIKRMQAEKNLEVKVCVTAQHREMLDKVLDLFSIRPDYDLDIMCHGQTVTDITVKVLKGINKLISSEQPDFVLVHGDTTTTFATSLAAFYSKIPVGHVEAGLRSGNIYSPYPEEMNRRLTGTIAALHFAPTEGNRQNLIRSGVNSGTIFVTGNTVIDALHMVIDNNYQFSDPTLDGINYVNKKIILMTAHRRENWGDAMRNIFIGVRKLLEHNPDTLLIFPVHNNPRVKDLAREIFEGMPHAHLVAPLDYASFANLMSRCFLVLTDSGGIQEEAPALGKPVLVLRNETERPEAVIAGTVKIAGVEQENIYNLAQKLLHDRDEYLKMARAINPYGDGKAAERIVSVITGWLS